MSKSTKKKPPSAASQEPAYPSDDGPLTAKEHDAIFKEVRKTHGRATIVASLFPDLERVGSMIGTQKK